MVYEREKKTQKVPQRRKCSDSVLNEWTGRLFMTVRRNLQNTPRQGLRWAWVGRRRREEKVAYREG